MVVVDHITKVLVLAVRVVVGVEQEQLQVRQEPQTRAVVAVVVGM